MPGILNGTSDNIVAEEDVSITLPNGHDTEQITTEVKASSKIDASKNEDSTENEEKCVELDNSNHLSNGDQTADQNGEQESECLNGHDTESTSSEEESKCEESDSKVSSDNSIEEVENTDNSLNDSENIEAPKEDIVNGNKEKDEKTEKEETKSEEKNDSEGKEVPMKYMDVKISITGISDPVTVQLSNHDTVQDIRQVILEKPECCYRTCFSLQLNGKRLDDFTELHDVPDLTEDSIIKCIDEPYSVREARIHIRRLRDLLVTTLEPNAFTATDNMSLSYCSAITGIDVEEEALKGNKEPIGVTESVLPPEHVLLKENEQPELEHLLIDSKEVQLPPCLKDLRYSAWNPPPGSRKLAGDLLYILVKTLEDNIYHITASSSGFYVNKSTFERFDPNPLSEPNRAQTLVAVLNQLSSMFKKNFASIQRISTKKHPLELVASPLQVFPWISPRFEHTVDPFRAEDAVTSRIGYEEQIPGQLRDWNEELQSAKELPKKNLHQRILRDRALYKITCDFIAAGTRGAMAVVDGNVMAINPGEDEKMRMYIWNNIFFSFACDSREHYQKYGGDEAAYAAASLDLKGVEVYNKLDIDGLHTLGTVVVDYRGYRIVAQSIIPGILQREQENSVVYGSVDGGKTISGHDKFLEKLNQAGLSLKIRPHKVINEKNEEVELCSSIECKGIIGADGRHYILDLFRTFPPDVNFLDVPKVERQLINGEPIKPDEDSTEKDNSKFKFPTPHDHQLCSLRPTLLEAFIGYKYVSFVKVIALHKLHDDRIKAIQKKSEESTEETSEEKSIEAEKAEEVSENCNESEQSCCKDKTEEGTETPSATGKEGEVTPDVLAATKAIGSLSSKEFDIRFNPDAHVKEIKLAESEAELDRLDKALIEDAAVFLADTVVPKMVEDFSILNSSPLDGLALTEIMHARGVNMRYLGKVATLVAQKSNLDHVYKIVVKEMVVRSAKRQFKASLQSANQRCLSIAISHFLNCFLSSATSIQPYLPPDEVNPKKKKNKKKSQKLSHLPSNSNMAWLSVTSANLWQAIKSNISSHFGFKLEGNGVDEVIEKYQFQKISLLRELCRKTGVQIHLREYDFDNKKLPTFSELDILNLFPIVKTVTPKATDATAIFEASQSRLQSGFIGDAHELMIEALNMFNQVYGPLHPEIVVCYRAIARIHYLADDAGQAVAYQKKAAIVAERVYGIDHPETLVSYVHLALYCYHAGLVSPSLKLMYRARYLALLAYGDNHPDMATFDTNIGLMLHSQREFTIACEFLERAVNLQTKYHGKESLHTATGHHLVARVLSAVGQYKSALAYEKNTFAIYQKHFGKDDARTKESSEALKAILNQAVMLQKTLKDISEKGTINPSRVPKLDVDDKKILTMVNKIDDVSTAASGATITEEVEKGAESEPVE